MVNYGWTCEGWTDEKKLELVELLTKLCDEYPDSHGMFPYIEHDVGENAKYNLYEGVRIRRITHLTDEKIMELVNRADKIKLSLE